MKNIFFVIGLIMISINLHGKVQCDGLDNHRNTIAQCLFKNMVENQSSSSPWTEEIQKQVLDLSSKGFSNSQEYSVLFLGGTKSDWTYIVSVDFSNLDQFQSIAAVIKVTSSGNAIVNKVFSSTEIKDLIK